MNTNLENFYRLFWQDKTCQNVFLLHKELLLEKNSIDLGLTDYYLQRIVISNSLTFKDDVDEHLIFRQENRYTSIIKKLGESKDKYFSEEKFEKFAKNRFSQTINIAKKEIEDEGLWEFITDLVVAIQEEDGVLNILKEYKVVPDNLSDLEELGKYIEQEVTKETKNFLKKQNFSQMFLSIDDVSHFYHSIIKESLIKGYQQNICVLIDKENFKSRVKLFDKLYEIGVLIGGKFKSYFECINCLPDTFNGFITCNIKPSKIKVKCPQCAKETNYLVPYFIVDELFEQITHSDGLLFFAIEYLLNSYKIEYDKSVNLENGNELDIVLMNREFASGILEIKMFKNDKLDDVKIKNLKETIWQMKKSKKILIKADKKYSSVHSFLITNISDNNLVNSAKSDLRKDLKEFNIDIFTPNEFHKFVKDKL